MSTNHTPTPWAVTHRRAVERPVRISEHFAIIPLAGPTLAFLPEGRADIQEANAAFIVHAVNAHDDLVAALRDAAEALKGAAEGRLNLHGDLGAHNLAARCAALAKVQP